MCQCFVILGVYGVKVIYKSMCECFIILGVS